MDFQPHFSPKTLILFSQKDEKHQKNLELHLDFVARQKKIGSLTYESLDKPKKHAISSDNTIDNYIAVILLVSYPVVLSPFGSSDELEELVKADKLKRIKLLPIILDNCEFQKTSLKKIDLLSSNKIPVSQIPKSDYHDWWRELASEISNHLIVEANYHQKIEEEWIEVSKNKSKNWYYEFFQAYPFCKYSAHAKNKYNELVDNRLWEEARLSKNIDSYLRYIKDGHNRKYKNQAIKNIIEIECSENAAKQDIMGNENLGIFFDYKSRFRAEGDMKMVDEQIFNALNKPIDQWMDDTIEIVTDANWLTYQIYESCSKNSIYTFTLFEKFSDELARGLIFLTEKTSKLILGLKTYIYLIIPGFLLSIFLTELMLFEQTYIFRIPKSWFGVFLLSIIVLLGVYRIVRAFWLMRSDRRGFVEKSSELARQLVELKISFLTNDCIIQGNVIMFLYKTEEWIEANKNKTLWTYFLDVKKREHRYQKQIEAIEKRLNKINTSCLTT